MSLNRLHLQLCLFGLLLALGCSEPSAPDLPPEVLIGTGEWQFEPVAPGQQLTLVAGTQGGYHVWISLRARGFSSERLRMQLALRSAGPVPPALSDLEVRFEPAESELVGDLQEYVGWPAQLLLPWCAVEQPLTVEVTLSDGDGHSAVATAEIVPLAPARGFEQACEQP